MLISSSRNASQVIVPGHNTHFYDDLGCLASDTALDLAGARAFVQLADGSGWHPAERAYYVQIANLRTPMGYGFDAFASRDAGERASGGGDVHDLAGFRAQMRSTQ
jgi:hypothetical protein